MHNEIRNGTELIQTKNKINTELVQADYRKDPDILQEINRNYTEPTQTQYSQNT